jgi:hypothetical protein
MSSSENEIEKDDPVAAWCDDVSLHVRLADGREIVTPLWWYPSLLNATHTQRNNLELMFSGIHWPDLDEDLSIEGMLKGRKARNAKPPAQAAE